MAKRYTMIATQNGTTTVTWDNDDAPDGTGSGPTAPGGTLTNVRVLRISNFDKPFVEEGGDSWRNLNSSLMPGTLRAQYNFDGDHTDSSGNSLDLSPTTTPVAPTGQINVSDGGSVGIGPRLYLNDGYNGEVAFRHVTSAGSPTSHDREVLISIFDTQAQVATAWYNEILAAPLDITPTDNGTNVSLVNNRADVDGNKTISETITGITTTGMSGGIGKVPVYVVRGGLQSWATKETIDQDYNRPSFDASLALTGAMSIWAIIRMDAFPTGAPRIVSFRPGTGGEAEADNVLYQLYISNAVPGQLRYFCEHEAGQDNFAWSELALEVGKMSLVSLSRAATGEVTFFLNGESSSVAHNLAIPTGGGNGRLQITTLLSGHYGGLAITDAEHDLNDHLAMYDYVRNL